MMPDLGEFAAEVLTSYAISIAMLLLIVGASYVRARKVRAQLAEAEARQERHR